MIFYFLTTSQPNCKQTGEGFSYLPSGNAFSRGYQITGSLTSLLVAINTFTANHVQRGWFWRKKLTWTGICHSCVTHSFMGKMNIISKSRNRYRKQEYNNWFGSFLVMRTCTGFFRTWAVFMFPSLSLRVFRKQPIEDDWYELFWAGMRNTTVKETRLETYLCDRVLSEYCQNDTIPA